MRFTVFALLAVGGATALAAQRPVRLGPTFSVIALDEGSATQQFSSYGGSLALLSRDAAELGLVLSRYADLSSGSCERSMTFVGLDSYYYPIGAGGFAPFASTSIGVANVTDGDPGLAGLCVAATPAKQLAYAFGVGFRINVGAGVAGLFEGRFFQVPGSAIQALEARVNASIAVGTARRGRFMAGTVGPALGWVTPLEGAFSGRGPLVGVRFRRDLRSAATAGLEIYYAPLEVTEGCSTACRPTALLFAPGYEASVHPSWGRLYGVLGALLAGFPDHGADRGVAQGAHAGLGADVFTGDRVMLGIGARVLWMRRSGGDNAVLLLIGASVSPRIGPTSSSLLDGHIPGPTR